MRIFNQDKTQELTTYDLNKGYLKADRLFVRHHEAVEEVLPKYQIEQYRDSDNKVQTRRTIIVEPIAPRRPYDEYEDIKVYILYSAKELAVREVAELKQKLLETDYQAIKYAEGVLSEEEYSLMKAQRQAWRDRINVLEQV